MFEKQNEHQPIEADQTRNPYMVKKCTDKS